jgi:hypothetical protein
MQTLHAVCMFACMGSLYRDPCSCTCRAGTMMQSPAAGDRDFVRKATSRMKSNPLEPPATPPAHATASRASWSWLPTYLGCRAWRTYPPPRLSSDIAMGRDFPGRSALGLPGSGARACNIAGRQSPAIQKGEHPLRPRSSRSPGDRQARVPAEHFGPAHRRAESDHSWRVGSLRNKPER